MAGRLGLPAVAGPSFSVEAPHDDDYLGEGDPEVNNPPSPFGAPQQFLMSVVPRVGALLYYPTLRGRQRGRLALLGDLGACRELLTAGR